jgi:hypothetical protein
MPPSTVQWIASAPLASAGVLLMFEAVRFRGYRVELGGLPDRCQRLRASTGRCPRGDRPPGVSVWPLGQPVVQGEVVA